jgi:AhpD family alkylhydroperoxidase
MTPRMTNQFTLAPAAMKTLFALEATFKDSGLEFELLELLKLRASQINGCAYCLHMHATDARALALAVQRRLTPAVQQVNSEFVHALRAGVGRVHVQAVGAAVDL